MQDEIIKLKHKIRKLKSELRLYKSSSNSIDLHCNNCGKSVFAKQGDYFMLKDEIWKEVCNNDYVDKTYILCKKCTEKFLGRKLTYSDYSDAPCNEFILKNRGVK